MEGRDLQGKTIHLATIQKVDRIALNVYSPTCIPCVKELPALDYLHREIQKNQRGLLYLVVDPFNVTDLEEGTDFERAYTEAAKVMKEEVQKRNIQIPVLIMKKPFEVKPGTGLITGTPETLLFETRPLNLYYNFVGPISEAMDIPQLEKDTKILFFKKVFGIF
ncbi:MAG: TlpA family protein disulfide reductase [Leptospiraceae bacterium]|nr:TlpA family protein disulfide reductase [Leptospiraceae bacterium]MCP5499043.1 TlpA family protein disulfide reductase [Leptospiraceae bacterium]